MSESKRYGMRSLGDVVLDWMEEVEDESRKKGESLPETTQKGFADLRGKINKPPEAA